MWDDVCCLMIHEMLSYDMWNGMRWYVEGTDEGDGETRDMGVVGASGCMVVIITIRGNLKGYHCLLIYLSIYLIIYLLW